MKLLAVEDDPSLLRNLARVFREEGYAVDTAEDGETGLYLAQNGLYDAIVLDVMLPKLSGWEVLTRLRRSSKTPVLMLTARDAAEDRVRGLDGGADDYLAKPYDLAELLARIRALIRRAAGVAVPVIEFQELLLDPRSRTVRQSGRLVALTAREYGILEFLALHRGEVVSRATLHEHLVAEDDDTLSNLLDVHVFNLRKKLGQDVIQTRRGQGYFIP